MSRKPGADYLETYFQVVAEMERRSDAIYENYSISDKWDLAEHLTDEFEERYAHYGDSVPFEEWLVTLETFLNDKFKNFPTNK